MGLTILGKEPLDELEALARTSFDNVKVQKQQQQQSQQQQQHSNSANTASSSSANSINNGISEAELRLVQHGDASLNSPWKGLPVAVEIEPLRDVRKVSLFTCCSSTVLRYKSA
jgi:secreted Zn-dependent insulinase-like peptidase